MNELKPCPFCGGKAKIHKGINQFQNETIGVTCTKCLAYVGKVYNSDATEMLVVDQWNRRARKEAPHDAGTD